MLMRRERTCTLVRECERACVCSHVPFIVYYSLRPRGSFISDLADIRIFCPKKVGEVGSRYTTVQPYYAECNPSSFTTIFCGIHLAMLDCIFISTSP